MNIKKLYSIGEVATVLAISKSKVYQLVAAGRIQTVKIGRATRVQIGEIERFIESLESGI